MSGPIAGPTAVRRELGRRLRRMRERTEARVDDVAAHREIGISRAKLYKLEAGRHPARPQDVTALCRHYGASPEETEALTALALGTQENSWWHVYGEDAVPDWFSLYADLEPAASRIRAYEAELVPGLAQTAGYASAVYRARNPEESVEALDRRVAVRLERQAVLTRNEPAPPQFDVVLNEAALLRQVGTDEDMTEQLHKLRELAERPNVNIEVLTLAAGPHAAMETTFVVMDFPDPGDPSLVYIDTPTSAMYLQKPAELERYEAIFDDVRSLAIPIKEYHR